MLHHLNFQRRCHEVAGEMESFKLLNKLLTLRLAHFRWYFHKKTKKVADILTFSEAPKDVGIPNFAEQPQMNNTKAIKIGLFIVKNLIQTQQNSSLNQSTN